MGVRDPYQTYGLSHLINSYLQAMSAAPPPHPSVMGAEPTFPPDPAQAVDLTQKPWSDEDEAKFPGTRQAFKELFNDPSNPSTFSTRMRAAREGQKGVGRELALSPEESAKRPFVDKMRAAKAGQKAVGEVADKAATQAFIEKMQAARAAARGGATEDEKRLQMAAALGQAQGKLAQAGGFGGVEPAMPTAPMPMVPPQAMEPWKTPYTTQGVAGENAIGRELFGTGRRNWPPEPTPEE